MGAVARIADSQAALRADWTLELSADASRLRKIDIGEFAKIYERDNMRQVVLGFIVLAVIGAMSNSASARDRQSRRSSQSVQQSGRPGLFGGLVEMERRKNAWLRQSLGR